MFTHLPLSFTPAAGRFGDPSDPAAPHRAEAERLRRDEVTHRRARRREALRAALARLAFRTALRADP